MSTTANMGMVLPVVSSTPGPLYASENNQAFLVIDSHDHSPGNGVPIPTAGISLDADLPVNSFNVSLIRSSRYDDQTSPLSLPADIRSVYVVGGDLYYNNGIGQQIQITAGAALNATTIGGIGGDYATSTASEFYTSFTSTFTFWSAPNTPAAIDSGPLTLRTITTSPFGITINSPLTLSADYSLTLFIYTAVSTKILTVDPSGNVGAVYDVDNSTIEVSSNTIQVKTGGITTTQIASNTILNGNIADDTIGIVKMQSNLRTVTTFLADGTFTVPDDVTYVRVIGCGGGGGGGGFANGAYSGGGGGGAPVFEGIIEVIPGDVLTVTIGAGGAGGTNNVTGNPGSNGVATTITGTGVSLTFRPGAAGGGGQPGSPGIGGSGITGTHSGTDGGTNSVGLAYFYMGGTGTGGDGDITNGGGGGGSYGDGGANGTTSNGGFLAGAADNTGAGGGGLNRTINNGTAGPGGSGIVKIYVL